MSSKNFIKENFVLVVGLALPVLLMAGFFLATIIPSRITAPPQYDLVFATEDYQSTRSVPVSVKLLVKDEKLTAQYVKNSTEGYYGWRKIFLYDAKTQTVRELPFGFPTGTENLSDVKEEVVEATKDLKLDTSLKAPDGYELSYDGYWRGGLMTEVFWRGSYGNEVHLRKGAASHKLLGHDGRSYSFYSVQFLGWVKK